MAKSGDLYVANGLGLVRRIGADGVMSIYAGNGVVGFSGDGGPARSAEINAVGLGFDSNGNLLIAGGGAVRRVNAAGIISTVAGVGKSGFSGDGGAATSAAITVSGVALDSSGNLYIAGASAVRKVTPAGIISTIAGSGVSGYAALGFSGDGGPATSAQLNQIVGVVVDRTGAVFITDSGNQRIRKVNPDGIISTVAGSSTTLSPFARGARASSPIPLRYFIGGFGGDGGPGTSAELADPNGITFDSAGNLYIADTNNSRIRKLSTSGIITTVAGNGALESGPRSVTFDANDTMFIASGTQIRNVTREGIISTVWSRGTGVTNAPRGHHANPTSVRTASFLSWPAILLVGLSAATLWLTRFGRSHKM
jgi:hypothetical protein